MDFTINISYENASIWKIFAENQVSPFCTVFACIKSLISLLGTLVLRNIFCQNFKIKTSLKHALMHVDYDLLNTNLNGRLFASYKLCHLIISVKFLHCSVKYFIQIRHLETVLFWYIFKWKRPIIFLSKWLLSIPFRTKFKN